MAKTARERFKTYQNVLDEFTIRGLFKLITQGHFEGLQSALYIGKEANVFAAESKEGMVIVKIYRLETCDFNRMYDYIKYDPRYTGLKSQRRKVIFSWAQREYRNLMKARDVIRVPKPITFLNNILVLEFIGNHELAPKVKDHYPERPADFAEKTFEFVKLLYRQGMVHGDLSEFNILNYNEGPVFIDFSQATMLDNPRADEFLERDVRNMCNFFNKRLGMTLDVMTELKRIKRVKL